MRYTLNPKALLALLPLTADPKSNRVTLNGIHFEANGQGVATSGHVMGVYRDAIQGQSDGDAEPDWVRDIHGTLAHHAECAA